MRFVRLLRLVVPAVVTAMVGASLVLVASAPAQASFEYLCQAKTKKQIRACDTSGYADQMGKSWWGATAGHNCTNYASYRMHKSGVAFPGRMGNGRDWAASARKYGFKVNQKPAVGSIGTWENVSGINHVVYVEQVGPDWIVYSDDTYSNKTWRRIKVTKGEKWYPNRFIHFKDAEQTSTPPPPKTPTEPPVEGEAPAPAPKVKPWFTIKTYETKASSSRHAQVMVKVNARGKVPTGRVAVWKNGSRLASKVLRADHAGTVWITLPKLERGLHKVRVVYRGNAEIAQRWSVLRGVRVR